MQDREAVRKSFVEPREFWSSPLYRRLSGVVAADPFLVGVAAQARAGQWPTFAFFGAVHALLLDGTAHPLADYYASVRGDAARPPDAGADAALVDLVHEHEDALVRTLRIRLVQTNQVQRAVALRLGLSAVAAAAGGAVHLLEIGSSAGLLLRHDRYASDLGRHVSGVPGSPVRLVCEWRGGGPVPDLDAIPPIASTTGIDLNPLDPALEADRRWLEALVWPEDRAKAALLTAALDLAARHPVSVLAGDAVDLCPVWDAGLPDAAARVVFHSATRMHVPRERRPAFDAAIAATGARGPLHRIALEGDGLIVSGPGGEEIARWVVDGHLAWAGPA